LEIWKAVTTNAQYIIDEAAKLKASLSTLKEDIEVICEHKWWDKLRF